MALSNVAEQWGGAGRVKGLRLLTMDRGPEGFGFHMYTNKEREGQYIKSVARNSPADLAGMLPNDHVVGVDGAIVIGETHHQVSRRARDTAVDTAGRVYIISEGHCSRYCRRGCVYMLCVLSVLVPAMTRYDVSLLH